MKILETIMITVGIFLISLTGIILQELFFGKYLDKRWKEEIQKWWTGERKDYPIR